MPTAFAIFAHPDDIEFSAAGTLLLLKEAGWDIHYMNVSSGNLGHMTMTANETREVRMEEAQQAAKLLGFHWHPSLSEDMEIVYDIGLLRHLAAKVREVNPQIVFTHAPLDYMEDHMNTSRLAVSATFARTIPNFVTKPHVKHVETEVTIYHAQPHMNRDPLGKRVYPDYYVNIESVMERKREALALHASQKEWLDATQGMDYYVNTMEELMRDVGKMSGEFEIAEGWRKHLHIAFCAADTDPLQDVLKKYVKRNPDSLKD